MKSKTKDNVIFFLIGLALGIGIVVFSWNGLHKTAQKLKDVNFTEMGKNTLINMRQLTHKKRQVIENFSKPIKAVSGKSFGKDGQLTFELYRNGTFVIDGKSGYAWQKSASYRDSAIIRSTKALPKTYKISVVVGGIDYGLENISGLPQDPEYTEGPQNENGSYLIAITDTPPIDHHTNTWWHQHRKVAIDVDNNVWGHGMPNPVFMVYFDRENKLVSFDGEDNEWRKDWMKTMTYEPGKWYRVEIEKTKKQYILSVRTDAGQLLKSASVGLEKIWNADEYHKDYFAVGDPHENYYQGSMKIKEISMRY
ncbi:MAG TPA: hypothetical protein DE315_05870 [Candidatus Omnitrophica bacterium]|nr:hypothetical protein [Candidatus Omnitrophota bacterium]HCI45036.1 hypothetical protein [Candidatus Omnitrophota bacterium]